MRILAMERGQPGAAADDFRRLARAEAARAWELHQAGPIRGCTFVRIAQKLCCCWNARLYGSSMPRSRKRGRAVSTETVALAAENRRANQWRQ